MRTFGIFGASQGSVVIAREQRRGCAAVAQQRPSRHANLNSYQLQNHVESARESAEELEEQCAACSTSSSRDEMTGYCSNNLQRLERAFANVKASRGYQTNTYHWSASVFPVTLDEKKPQLTKNQERTPDYFANVGDAIRTLRDDIPLLFSKDLNYDIYREDILFKDPTNSFQGIKNYKLMFWSLRFHGGLFFSKLYVDVKRIWQPEDGVVKMRWTVHGIPRVPWEAEGIFDGISTYRLDASGKVFEHSVDNVLLRDPPMATNPLLAGLNLSPLAGSQTPQLGSWFSEGPGTLSSGSHSWWTSVPFSWLRLYAIWHGTAQLAAVRYRTVVSSRDDMLSDAGLLGQPIGTALTSDAS